MHSQDKKLRNLTVLFVEDEELIQMVMENILLPHVGELYLASNGEEGLELFKEKSPDVVITDFSMPFMNGLQMSREIRAIDTKTPIIITTSHDDPDLLIEAINSGITNFILKPVNIDTLLNLLETYSHNKRTEAMLHEHRILLDQYKDIVDENTIVSKANMSGKITYVNDAFCHISKYSRDELLNKPHSIVRHPDTDPKLYKSMWETIKNKKTWRGVIKNRAKDNSTYIVDMVIKPILDPNGEVQEYISIRHDITELSQLNLEIEDTQKELLYTLGELGETRSMETGNHVKRVACYSRHLAEKYGLSRKETELLYHASPMHDIGKIGIPDAILNKPGKLTPEEFCVMQTHAEDGYRLFKSSKREILKAASIIAHEHHERFDGTGYPRGLKSNEIHIFGRITAIADVFDALGSERVYKKGWELPKILEFLKTERGKHFDPELVDIFFEELDDMLEIRERFKDTF